MPTTHGYSQTTTYSNSNRDQRSFVIVRMHFNSLQLLSRVFFVSGHSLSLSKQYPHWRKTTIENNSCFILREERNHELYLYTSDSQPLPGPSWNENYLLFELSNVICNQIFIFRNLYKINFFLKKSWLRVWPLRIYMC